MQLIDKGIITSLNNKIILLTKDELITFESLNKIKSKTKNDHNLELAYTQLINEDNVVFAIDLKNSKMISIDDSYLIDTIQIKENSVPTSYLSTRLNDHNILFDSRGKNLYNLYDSNERTYKGVSGLYVSKYKSYFRKIDAELYRGKYNILDYSKNCEFLLYHLHDDGKSSEIGIYNSFLEKKIAHFDAPEEIECINWFNNQTDNTHQYSNVKGLITKDKIVLCFNKILYILDFEGKILDTKKAGDNKRFWDLTILNENELVIAEADEKNMFLSILDI